ncbi:zinc/manganese transport system ATP-binding protein [Kineococcus xinjiangensis]|uniref:Zinc/manganese transport system ATP-binding protein n=1 Tax=Kineococcus xinjiangensis TaxID=512762 RepID=A0A2S6IG79_9ACTN|nr:metal ABC transporter ATP-binding protein [Kineococcus xinjiangensis]PPK93197.1 zinc/manganese transport system ATP-binding protein [Kineococcus xinjiangensis]
MRADPLSAAPAGATTAAPAPAPGPPGPSALSLRGATLRYGSRAVWSDLDLDVAPGEFLAVLGANGSGKTSLLRVLLGQQALATGSATIAGRPVRRGGRGIGYVPQQKGLDPTTPLRARDFVRLGIDGHRWGPWLPSRSATLRVDAALAAVGATGYARTPVGTLSGGEQQRLRIAQALITDPAVLLCDEPLLSLDLHHQQSVSALIDRRRRESGAAVLFVTHDINPVLPYVDRVLYLAAGRFRVGPPEEVMTSAVLSELYGSPVEVVHSGGRLIVVGGAAPSEHPHCGAHDEGRVA